VIIQGLSLSPGAGEPCKILIDNTNILDNNNNQVNKNLKLNNISASSLQVGIVYSCGATLPKTERCRSLIAFLGQPKFMSEP